MEDTYDKEDSEFISADMPLEMAHNWADRRETTTYTIQDGDTLGQLARDFGVSRDTIRWINNLSSNTLRVGQKLIIPPGNGYVYTTQIGDTLESIARKYTITLDEILKNNPHISHPVNVGSFIYLPGMKAPVVTPVSVNREDEAIKLENTFTHKLTLINPKGK
jgi:LysM repeat protein